MIQTYVQLVSPTDSLILDAMDGWGILNLDLGDSEVRAQEQNAPDADGILDFTAYNGKRTVTLGLELVEFSQTMWTMVTRLKGFQRPRTALKMYVQLADNAPLLQADIRKSNWSDPLDNLWILHPVMQWVVPKGIFQSALPVVDNINAASSGAEGGRTYDRIGDRVYTGGTILGQGYVTNLGNAEEYPLLRVYGPCTNPVIINDTQGKRLTFTSLTINVGEFLEIDTRYKTIRYQGLASDSRYSNLDFTATQWWTLSPGINALRFIPATYSAGTNLEVTHYDAYDI